MRKRRGKDKAKKGERDEDTETSILADSTMVEVSPSIALCAAGEKPDKKHMAL